MAPMTPEKTTEHDKDKRVAEAERILAKYPDRVPVIVEKADRANLPDIEKKKFIVPSTMLCGEFKYTIHKQIKVSAGELNSDQTIYLFVAGKTPKQGANMLEIYEQYKAEDGFLYITYSAENTLGQR